MMFTFTSSFAVRLISLTIKIAITDVDSGGDIKLLCSVSDKLALFEVSFHLESPHLLH